MAKVESDANASGPSDGRLLWAFCATIFVSAFLLFQVQPLIAKMILPWFGGSPAVWTTCMLFFQLMLVAGYGYAHLLINFVPTRTQSMVHIGLLVCALPLAYIVPSASWKPTPTENPTWQILGLLGACVGLPYFLLSSTGPLLQAWYARAYPGESPYRLYSLSNVGSLAALLTFPFVIEPLFAVDTLGWEWAAGFWLFAALAGGIAIYLLNFFVPAQAAITDSPAASASPEEQQPPTFDNILIWLMLPALAVVLLLSVTNHVCQDVAVVPFLWVVPLALYLITFILAFDSDGWYIRPLFAIGAILGVIFVSTLMIDYKVDRVFDPVRIWLNNQIDIFPKVHTLRENFVIETAAYFLTFFCVAMVCHGELANRKPASKWLTGYFLCISIGGALGGMFVAIICPLIFRTYLELNYSLIGGLLVGIVALAIWLVNVLPARGSASSSSPPQTIEGIPMKPPAEDEESTNLNVIYLRTALGILGISFIAFVGVAQYLATELKSVETTRTFYGVIHVTQEYHFEGDTYVKEFDGLALRNGRILHGFQYTDPLHRYEPTTYYIDDSGLGRAINAYKLRGPVRVAIVGLGTGTAATYCRAGDVYRFYEINPVVERVAREHFTYLKDAGERGKVEVVLGDARISMEREEKQNYDIIGLDAFSGDAIPAHLLTVESFGLYLKHLKDNGTVAIHVSNRYLDLIPVCRAIAHHYKMDMWTIDADDSGIGNESATSSSTWVLVTKNPKNLDEETLLAADESKKSEAELKKEKELLWTDGYSDLFSILKVRF